MRVADALSRYRDRPRALAAVLAWSIGVQVLRIGEAYILGLGLGLTVPFSAYLLFMPIGLLMLLLPVSVSGFGLPQGVFVWMLRPLGVPDATSFALSTLIVLTGLAGSTTEAGLRSLGDDPAEILGWTQRESGWMTIRGLIAYSSMETIHAPAIYAVLVERVAGFAVADLPFERCQRNGDLLPKGPLGDGPSPVAGDEQ